jgi:hypothetical protein
MSPLGSLALEVHVGRPFDPTVGSGKSVTPCERMHPEYFTAIASSAADALGLAQPEGAQPETERFDEAPEDPPPQAANPIPTVTKAASSAADRQRGPSLLGT